MKAFLPTSNGGAGRTCRLTSIVRRVIEGSMAIGAPGGRRERAPRRPDDDVIKVHGARAARAVLERRPDAIVRGYFEEARKASFSDVMRALAAARVAYRLVPADELDRVAASRHHEGICLLVKPRPIPSLEAWISRCPPAALALVLDGVENPHNLGAIVRTAAHFGARALWCVGQAPLHGAMARVAEGGAEAVDVWSVPSPAPVLAGLSAAGFQVVGADQAGPASVFDHRFARRTALVLGAEHEGLSALVRPQLEVELAIPGTGAVESLNVASAAAVLMAEYARQRANRPRRGGEAER